MLSKILFIIFLWKYLLRQWLFFSIFNFFIFSVACFSQLTFEFFFYCFLVWTGIFFLIPDVLKKKISLIVSCFFLILAVYLYLKWYFFFFENLTEYAAFETVFRNNKSVNNVFFSLFSKKSILNTFYHEMEIQPRLLFSNSLIKLTGKIKMVEESYVYLQPNTNSLKTFSSFFIDGISFKNFDREVSEKSALIKEFFYKSLNPQRPLIDFSKYGFAVEKNVCEALIKKHTQVGVFENSLPLIDFSKYGFAVDESFCEALIKKYTQAGVFENSLIKKKYFGNLLHTSLNSVPGIFGELSLYVADLTLDQKLQIVKQSDNKDILNFQSSIEYTRSFSCTFGSEYSYFELDGLSFLFFLLTVFCFPICFLLIWNLIADIGLLLFLLFVIEFILLLVFTSTNLLLFYVFFEMLLLPMSVLIINWGSRLRKLKAMYYFFIYTLFTSLFMLIGIFLIYFFYGTTSFIELSHNAEVHELSLQNKVIWLLLFFALAAKIPMYPFHLWLPEAHVEAPTVGSVLLAALLLKIGGYGFLRILIGCFIETTNYFRTFVFVLALLSIIYSSLILLRQIDMKKLIAYSSIAHMNVAVLGLFSNNLDGIVSGLYFLISHGFSSSALFILVGILYERFSTRIIFNYGGLLYLMPKFGFFFFIMVLANFGFPGTANFIAEAGVIISLIEKHFFCVFVLFLGILLSVVYSLFLFIRVLFGRLPVFFSTLANTRTDLTKREFWVLLLLLFFTLLFGLITVNFLNLVSLVLLTFFF